MIQALCGPFVTVWVLLLQCTLSKVFDWTCCTIFRDTLCYECVEYNVCYLVHLMVSHKWDARVWTPCLGVKATHHLVPVSASAILYSL